MLKLCAYCPSHHGKHIKYGNTVDGEWSPITEAVLKMIKAGREISHGICPSCFKIEMDEMDRDARREKFLKDKKRNQITGDIEEAEEDDRFMKDIISRGEEP